MKINVLNNLNVAIKEYATTVAVVQSERPRTIEGMKLIEAAEQKLDDAFELFGRAINDELQGILKRNQ